MRERALATRLLGRAITRHHPLDLLLQKATKTLGRKERAFVQNLCYGTLRWYIQLAAITDELLHKPLPSKEDDIRHLLMIALFQLRYLGTAEHAAVHASVETCHQLGKSWARPLVNACLRKFLRNQQSFDEKWAGNMKFRFAFPDWLITEIQTDWPENWESILKASNQHPPLALRVNAQRLTRKDYIAQLRTKDITASPVADLAHALLLEKPMPREHLPGFNDGIVSIQDAGSQMAAALLNAKAGERILDACAAPGGKAAALLESTTTLAELVVVEQHSRRFNEMLKNFSRLRLSPTAKCADVGLPDTWFSGRRFDRILLDAPCSATGVIRRHPEIKLRRTTEHVTANIAKQSHLLRQLWPLLAPGGTLLYVTCSILNRENDAVIGDFLKNHPEAKSSPINLSWGRKTQYGHQILPGEHNADGFYYAQLCKT